jgi:hypothetical protein
VDVFDVVSETNARVMGCKRGHANGDRGGDNVHHPRPAVKLWDADVGLLLRSRPQGAEYFRLRGPIDCSRLPQASSHRIEEPRRRSLGQLDLDLTEASAAMIAAGGDDTVVVDLSHGAAGALAQLHPTRFDAGG